MSLRACCLPASMTGTSVGGLFLAGVVPGVLLGLAFLLMNYYYSRKYDFPYSVMSLNVTIALITPPMGACLFIVSAVGKVKLDEVFRTIWPFAAVALAAVLLIIVFPALATTVPRMLGF